MHACSHDQLLTKSFTIHMLSLSYKYDTTSLSHSCLISLFSQCMFPGTMSGVWIFDKNGVARLIANPTRESFEKKDPPFPGTATAPGARPRVLVYLPANQVIRSYAELEQRLTELGWTRYHNPDQPYLLQFHKSNSSAHLLSFPKNFANFKSVHMYDVVVKNRSFFQVRDPQA